MFFYSVLNMKQTLSERVMLILDDMKISQTELARIAGVTKGAVNQWLNTGPGATMKPEPAFSISDQTRFAARWLMIGEGPIEKETPNMREKALLDAYRATDERGKMAIHRIAETESAYSVEATQKNDVDA